MGPSPTDEEGVSDTHPLLTGTPSRQADPEICTSDCTIAIDVSQAGLGFIVPCRDQDADDSVHTVSAASRWFEISHCRTS
jgi:hypothetical protein